MLVREHGTIVNISSDAAREPYPNWGSYSVSKAALHHLTEIWKSELSPSPIRFLSLDPGEMDTQMHADALPDANPSELQDPADVAERLVSEIEAGR
jgi:NAD(P)-dependent dehydrogenase (short-subunit alcohol dehydrogenase family)